LHDGPLTADRLRQLVGVEEGFDPRDGDRVLGFPKFKYALLHAAQPGWVQVYWLGGDAFRFTLTDKGREVGTNHLVGDRGPGRRE
jgi:hypothetical protein